MDPNAATTSRTVRVVHSDVHVLSLRTMEWREVLAVGTEPHHELPSARRGHTMCVAQFKAKRTGYGAGTALIMFGGQGPDGVRGVDVCFGDLWLYWPKEARWQRVEASGSVRNFAAMRCMTLTGLAEHSCRRHAPCTVPRWCVSLSKWWCLGEWQSRRPWRQMRTCWTLLPCSGPGWMQRVLCLAPCLLTKRW